MDKVTLTPSQARKIILHAAGLSKRAQFGKGKEAVYKFIDHLGFVQVDTNYVVERAHHHAIFARVPDYKIEWLEELQSDGRIFEGWTFASSFIPMYQYRFTLPVKKSFALRRQNISAAEVNMMRNVLDRIGREGPLGANDFENDRVGKSSGWWDWRPSKIALERLNFDGRLMTLRKKDFRKIYDLPENIVPSDVDTSMPTDAEFIRHVIFRGLRGLGIGVAKDVANSVRYIKNALNEAKKELVRMAENGEVCVVEVKGLKSGPLYMLPEYAKKKITLTNEAFILSPFDSLAIFRHRLKDFFDFDYQVECFVPEPKRKYGYFSLPILIGESFVARMDSKADRKLRTLTVHNLHFEKIKMTKAMISKLTDAIKAFAKFNQCDTIIIRKSNDKSLMQKITSALS